MYDFKHGEREKKCNKKNVLIELKARKGKES